MDHKEIWAAFLISLGLVPAAFVFVESVESLNHNKAVNEGCMDVASGPVCEGSVGRRRAPSGHSGYMMLAMVRTCKATCFPGFDWPHHSNPRRNNFMPPAGLDRGLPRKLPYPRQASATTDWRSSGRMNSSRA